MAGILDGIRVVEWALMHVGPHAAAMLADLGAEVIKIEERGVGDPMRGSTWTHGIPVRHASGLNLAFEKTNRNKRGMVLDLKKEEGQEVVYRLVEKSDVFLTNYRKDVAQRLGLDYETLRQHNPKLVYAHASGYGPLGPDSHIPGQDHPGMGRSGIMMIAVNSPDDEPYSPFGLGDQIGAMVTAYGVIAALLARERHGFGQEVDTSILGSLISLQTLSLGLTALTGREVKREPRLLESAPLRNDYRCADGKWLALGMAGRADKYWPAFCQALDIEELEQDPRFASRDIREAHSGELIAILDQVFARKTRDEWLQILKDYDLVAAPILSHLEVLEDPQALLNEYIVSYDHPVIGRVKYVGCPAQFSRTPARIERPAPELGQHTETILQEVLGYSGDDIARLKEREVI